MLNLKGHILDIISNLKKEENDAQQKDVINHLAFLMLQDMESKSFGDCLERLLKEALNLEERLSKLHDATYNSERVEIKCSSAIHQVVDRKKNDLKAALLKAALKKYQKADRIVYSTDDDRTYKVHMKQVKPDQFEHLLFGVCYADCVGIYLIPTSVVEGLEGYSNIQHAGNEGEGQVSYTEVTIDRLKDYKVTTLSYYDIFTRCFTTEDIKDLLDTYTSSVNTALKVQSVYFENTRKVLD